MTKKMVGYAPGIILWCMAQWLSAAVEIGEPYIRNFDNREYQGAAQVWSIAQDQRGMMYFGTWGEILEFDGKTWRRVEMTNQSPARSLAVGRDGVIYAGGIGDFGFLGCDSRGQLVYQSLVDKLPPDKRNFKDVWETFATSHGVYFVTLNQLFHWHKGKMSVLSLIRKGIGHVIDGQLFMPTSEGIYRFSPDTPVILAGCEVINESRYAIILPGQDSTHLLIVTVDKGCYEYDLAAGTTDSPAHLKRFPTEIDGYLLQNLLYKGVRLGDQGYALATWKGGIVILDHQGKLVRVINENRGLISDTVNVLFKDRSDNLWVGMQGGIAYIESSSPLSRFGKLSGIRSSVTAITRHQGRIFAGVYAQGARVLPPYQLQIQNDAHKFSAIENIKGRYAWDFLSLGERLLVADEGLYVVTNGRAAPIENSPIAYSLCQSRRFPKLVFLGIAEPNDGGLGYLEGIDQEPGFAYRGKLPGVHEVIRKVISDDRGDLWLATHLSGIIQVRFKGINVQEYEVIRYTTEHGLPYLSGLSIFLLNNHVCVGTLQGLYKTMPVGDPHQPEPGLRFTRDHSLTQWFDERSAGVIEVVKYKPEYDLVLSTLGIGFFSRPKAGFPVWDNQPFHSLNEVEKTWLDPDGVLWLTTGNGVVRYDPRVKKNYQSPFSALIRQVKINSVSEIFQGAYYLPASRQGNIYTVFSTAQPQAMIPTLEYRNNSLSFYYSCTSYEQMQANRYQYQLVGFDKEWSRWNEDTKREYTNIPEGQYVFKVQARNSYECLSAIAAYQFAILPPWQRTIFAYLGFLFIFILIIALVVRLNSRRLIAAKEKLEKIVAERTHDLAESKKKVEAINEELKDFAYIVSHDLKAPLRGITQLVSWLQEDEKDRLSEAGIQNLELMQGRVLRMDDLIAGVLSYSRAAREETNIELIDLNIYLPELIAAMAPPDNMEIVIEKGLPIYRADRIRIGQLFQNLVSNAIKYIDKPQGKIHVGCRELPTHWEFFIRDNGPGIPEKFRQQIFQIFQTLYVKDERQSTGVGLAVVKKIVDFYQGKIWVESEVGQGATFFFTLHKRD